MLTRGQAKVPLNVLVVLSVLSVLCSTAATILTIVKKYIGFGVYANPIACTSSSSYFTQKYNQNNYIIAINITEVLSVLVGTALMIIVVVLRVKLSRGADDSQEIFQPWSERVHRALFLLPSISIVLLVVPTAFFFSFVIQVGGSCSSSVLTEWLIIGALAALALILSLASAIVPFKLRAKFDPPEEEIGESEAKEKNQQKLTAKNEIEKIDHEDIKLQQLGGSKINDFEEIRDIPTNKQFLGKEINQVPVQQLTRSGLRQPLITVHEPPLPANSKSQKSNVTQSQIERSERNKLQALRRQRLQEEKRIQQLKRKGMQDREKKEEKSTGNQTIINIHLDGTRGGSITQKQAEEDPQPQRNRKKKKTYEALRSPIYQELSEDSEYHYQRKYKQPMDDRRFYSKKQYEAKETNPYGQRYEGQLPRQNLQRHPSQQLNTFNPKPTKKLSLGHLTSVQITPTISPKPISGLIPGTKYEESQVQKLLDKDKYEESFYKKLQQESVVRDKGLQEPKAPRKDRKPKQSNLEAYIEALNLSMNVNRPDYENNYYSNGSEVSYNSVLSNRVGAMPAEREYHTRRQPKTHPVGRDNNLLTVTQNIEQKYKRN